MKNTGVYMEKTAYDKFLDFIKLNKYDKELPYREILPALGIKFSTLKTYKDTLNVSLNLSGEDKYKIIRERKESTESEYNFEINKEFDKLNRQFYDLVRDFYNGKVDKKDLLAHYNKMLECVEYNYHRYYNFLGELLNTTGGNLNYLVNRMRSVSDTVYKSSFNKSKFDKFITELLLLEKRFSYKSIEIKCNILGYVPKFVDLGEELKVFKTNQTRIRNSYVDYEVLGMFRGNLIFHYNTPIEVFSSSKYKKQMDLAKTLGQSNRVVRVTE